MNNDVITTPGHDRAPQPNDHCDGCGVTPAETPSVRLRVETGDVKCDVCAAMDQQFKAAVEELRHAFDTMIIDWIARRKDQYGRTFLVSALDAFSEDIDPIAIEKTLDQHLGRKNN